MSNTPSGSSLLGQVWRGALTLLLSAIAVRVAWELVSPLIVPLAVLLVVGAGFYLYRQHNRW